MCHQVVRSSKAPKDCNAFIFRDWQSKKKKFLDLLNLNVKGALSFETSGTTCRTTQLNQT